MSATRQQQRAGSVDTRNPALTSGLTLTLQPNHRADLCCKFKSPLTRRSGQRYFDGASTVHAPGVTPDCGRNGVGGTATSAGSAPIVERAYSQDEAGIESGTLQHDEQRAT